MASDTASTSSDEADLALSWSGRWTLGYRILALNLLTVALVALCTLVVLGLIGVGVGAFLLDPVTRAFDDQLSPEIGNNLFHLAHPPAAKRTRNHRILPAGDKQ